MKYIFLVISFFCLSLQYVSAQEKGEIKTNEVYAFGYATSLSDSIIYLTEIAPMPTVTLEKKTGFLVSRASYTAQLKDFASKIGINHPTCAIVYDKNKKKLEKKFVRLTKKFQKNKNYFIKAISSQEFTFKEIATE